MGKKPFYITTPIYYPSDKLHIGHSYCTVATDVMARYKRMQGYDVMFLTGTDEHGQKIEEKAKAAGVTPKEYVDKVVAGIQGLWELMNISEHRFIRTTDSYHEESVQKIFKALYERGEIYKGKYSGKYCTPCESFWTETQLVDGKCPDCGREVIDTEEEAYFFRLSQYGDRLLKLYQEHPEFLTPSSRVHEMVNNFIKPGLEDLCVSRTSFSWGVPVDFDPKHVVYVWVDALSNYITALGYGNSQYDDYDRYWPADVHIVGKDIVRFHSIIWPAMLMALDLPLPKRIYGHGWLLIDGGKMSKSKGNVVDPQILCQRYGVDAIRYFLLREFPFGSDGEFTNEALVSRINSDLANDLGNLVSRTVSMVIKYFDGKLPTERQADPMDDELIALATALKGKADAAMEEFQLQNVAMEAMKLISRTNKYIDETAPWVLCKEEKNRARLATVLYNMLDCIRTASIFLAPFMPSICPKIWEQIGASEKAVAWETSDQFGLLPLDVEVKKGEALFPRIDVAKELAELEALNGSKTEKAASAPAQTKEKEKEKKKETPEGVASLAEIISIDDFAKVALKTAQVVQCERVEKSDKLLKLQLDDGTGIPRQVVSGIAAWYTPEDLTGKKVIVVSNLKPAKLRGVLSQGMILAADAGENQVKVVFVEDSIPNGSTVR